MKTLLEIKYVYTILKQSYNNQKEELKIRLYYVYSYRLFRHKSNENANRLIRWFLSKGIVITNILENYIKEIKIG